MFFKNKYNLNNFSENLSLNKLFFTIILFEIGVFIFLNQKNFLNSPNLQIGDAYSFYFYNYSNLENFLGQYRSFGGPLYVKFYKIFSEQLNYWGTVNYIFFSLSLLLFFYSLVINNFNKVFSFFLILGILGSTKLWYYFSHWSEVLSIISILLTISFYFFSYKQNKNYQYLFFTFLLFYTYQIRPLFVVFVFTFIFLEFYLIKFDKKDKIFKFKNLKIINFTLLPLIIFLIFRFFVTGHLGIAPYVGAHLGAHAIFHLNENSIGQISTKNKKFAEDIHARKLLHHYPCNLNYDEIKKLNNYTKCYTENTMSLMLEMIKNKTNQQPFDSNNEKNYNSWKYLETLDQFFMKVKNYNNIDNSLKEFSYELIGLNLNNFLNQIKLNIYNSYVMQVKMNPKLIYIYLVVIFLFILIFLFNKKSISKDKSSQIKLNGILLFFLISNFISIFILSTIHLPKPRLMSVQGVFFIPILFSYLIGAKLNILKK